MKKVLEGYKGYIIDSEGKIYRVNKHNQLREIAISKGNYDFNRVNLQDNEGKVSTKLVHTLVYENFRNKEYSNIVFLDNDKNNCNIENLMSVEELRDFYNTMNKKIIQKGI